MLDDESGQRDGTVRYIGGGIGVSGGAAASRMTGL